jgi:hypothetical protein
MLAMKFELQTVYEYFVSACDVRIFSPYLLFINPSPELMYSTQNVFEGVSSLDGDIEN